MKRYPEIDVPCRWFASQGWSPMDFQVRTWRACLDGQSGLLNAPTGSGKTYALFIGAVMRVLRLSAEEGKSETDPGLFLIWITPVRALTKDIRKACEAYFRETGMNGTVAIRTGDTPTAERAAQRKRPPNVLITTPESLHLILASKGYKSYLRSLRFVVADEWHELMGSKRAVQLELALSRIKSIASVQIWGISATIGNLDQAVEVLLGENAEKNNHAFIRADIRKEIRVRAVIPPEVDKYPWAGNLGTKLIPEILPVIERSKSTLIFTNTRSQAELWYQQLLEAKPELAGLIAMHHGSISRELRNWVEDALHDGRLKCVVCTSSLDLGVDFRPVETIIQVGSPKGVARFVQRAGRSGHAPGKAATIYFLPTNGLQLIECAALKRAIDRNDMEDRMPYVRSFDVLVQYLVTLAVSDGFRPAEVLLEVRSTFSYRDISDEEWEWALNFVTLGGKSLGAYDEFKKVIINDEGLFVVADQKTAMRHRLSIGTIVSDAMLAVKFRSGGYLGSIEEWFIARLSPGDTFWFAGRPLELIRVKEMTALVKLSKKRKGAVPSWQGGRLPLSAMLSENLRIMVEMAARNPDGVSELEAVQPIILTQSSVSHTPGQDEFLIEKIRSREGFHVFFYPFEGRFVHEGMASLLAFRLSLLKPLSFSIAVNDYGFELLSDEAIPIDEGLDSDIFSTDHLLADIQSSLNKSEMSRRRFRDIAGIAGLVFKGFPGKHQSDKHLQSSAGLFYDVFESYDPANLLYRQAFTEVMEFQIEEFRLRQALRRIQKQKIVLTSPDRPTPFCFPIMIDRLRGKMTFETLRDRISKMTLVT